MFIHFWEREYEQGRDRERETEHLKWALHWQQRTRCGAWTHQPWDHDLSWRWMLNWLSHPGAQFFVFIFCLFILRVRRGREGEKTASRLHVVSTEPNVGLKLMHWDHDLTTLPKIKSRSFNWLSHWGTLDLKTKQNRTKQNKTKQKHSILSMRNAFKCKDL